MRRIFSLAEKAAFFGGIIISFILVILWPALMLTAGQFSLETFTGWAMMVLVWGIIAAIFIGIVPQLLNVIQVGPF